VTTGCFREGGGIVGAVLGQGTLTVGGILGWVGETCTSRGGMRQTRSDNGRDFIPWLTLESGGRLGEGKRGARVSKKGER